MSGSLTALSLMGLAGCQQLMSPPSPRHVSILDSSGPTPTITNLQEADAQVALGRVVEEQGDLEGAMAAYRSALDRDRKRADIYQRMAVLYDKQGKFRESADLYRQALEAEPGNPEIFCDMGYSLYLQRRWAEAEMNLRQAIVRDKEHRRAHNNLGLVLAHNARSEEALEEFRKGGCDDAQAHDNLAFALSTEGRWEEAREQYRQALKVVPASTVAGDRLRELDAVVAKLDAPGRSPSGPTADPAVALASATAVAPAASPANPRPVAPRIAPVPMARTGDPATARRETTGVPRTADPPSRGGATTGRPTPTAARAPSAVAPPPAQVQRPPGAFSMSTSAPQGQSGNRQ